MDGHTDTFNWLICVTVLIITGTVVWSTETGSSEENAEDNNDSMDYLKYKWGIFFDLADVNYDGMVDLTDVEKSKKNIIDIYNMTECEAVFKQRRLQTIWDVLAFRGMDQKVGFNRQEMVDKITQVFQQDPETFGKEIRAAYQDFVSFADTNMNSLIDNYELMRVFQLLGHNKEIGELAYFKGFNETHGIPLHKMVDAWVVFHTRKDRVDDDPVTEPIKETI